MAVKVIYSRYLTNLGSFVHTATTPAGVQYCLHTESVSDIGESYKVVAHQLYCLHKVPKMADDLWFMFFYRSNHIWFANCHILHRLSHWQKGLKSPGLNQVLLT